MNNNDLPPLNALVACHNLSKSFDEGTHHLPILKQIDFTLNPKERIAIIGASGSGKSTFLHLLAGLDRPSQGTIAVMGQSITHYSAHQLSQLRNRHIGFIYQFHHLLPEFTLLENVAMPLLIRGTQSAMAQQKAFQLLEHLGLSHRAHHRPSESSGGERQRAAVARAMITQPAFILADEPTGNLDSHTAHALIDILSRFDQTGIIIVTHDMSIAQRMDKILKLDNGYLVSTDTQASTP